ncbi:KIF25-like protein [Mya arenaria]|uniref:KIF25-like protein n=1 Tax=Mya arenaria TaxID=6604 RepID=A0ABY7EII9_MYAAR|nr:KIF25-like protein [Mya arenaria]
MPLGIDRTDFLNEKNKRLERELRTRDERIASLETENAMLYLKLAQLRSNLQYSREEVSGFQSQYESETKFRQNVIDSALRFKQELESIKRKMASLQRVAVDLPIQFQNDIKHANTVVQRHRHMFVSQTSNLTTMQDQLSNLQEALNDITDRHAKEKKRRQELHNLLMELRGNIRVHCRVRPLMDFDRGGEDSRMLGGSGTKSEVVVHYMDDENVCVRTTKHNKVFEYERVYSPAEAQDSVFDEVSPMLTSLLDGHKNEDYHLRMEPHKDEGVIPRAARELFRLISEKPDGKISVEVSVVEIYNNDIQDLLSGDPHAKHDVITGPDGSLSIPTLTSKKVKKIQDVMSFVQYGLRMRREASTMVHEHSSRSHLIVTLTVNSQAPSFLTKPSAPSPIPENETDPSGIPYAVRAALLSHIANGRRFETSGRSRTGRNHTNNKAFASITYF